MVELEAVKEDIYRLRNKAEQRGNLNVALQGCDKALKALELHAKVRQIIDSSPTVNIHMSAEWIEIRRVILQALAPYEGARASVLGALEGVERNAS